MLNFLYIGGCIFFTVLGQLLIKKGAICIKSDQLVTASYSNVYIALGLFSAVLAAASWIKALQFFDLSYAYPFMSLSFVLVAILSVLVFGETMKVTQWIGLFVIMVGLYLGSR